GAIMGAFLWGGMLHLVGRMFGNRQPYERTFRVSAYSRAPMLLFSAMSAFITPFLMPAPTFNPNTRYNTSPVGTLTSIQYSPPSSPADGGASSSSDSTTQPRYGGSSNPFDTPALQQVKQMYLILGPLMFIFYFWVWCLQAIGLKYAQNISGGAAGGTVFVALLIPVLILGVIGVLFGVLIAAAMSGARGSSGFQNMLSFMPSGLAVWRGL
ncbi:MAG: hypothetical protein JWN14_4539, partial [Chthonomonadales bacterium]|nr:hypothetical protein [Chthonomonadales bacterium]